MNPLAPVFAYSVAVPNVRRGDTAEVIRRAAAYMETAEINGNVTFARPEIALTIVAGNYGRGGQRIPQPWILPLYRDVLGMWPRELTEWETDTPVMGRAMVLRALAHAVENGDLP